MQRATVGWVGRVVVLSAISALTACEPKGSPGGAAPTAGAPAGAKPAVKISSEPMKPEEMAASGGARAVLTPAVATAGFSGKVTFTQEGDQLHVVADLAGVAPPGKHGFHIHETGQCDHDQHFTTAGGHFNPTGAPHGCPEAAAHHAGDLGNVIIQADGTGRLDITTSMLSLAGSSSVIGKAVILHAAPDDCTSQPAGNAGARLACGVVASGSAPAAGAPPGGSRR
jgi:superoxide dismutase, Cu-Zn family